MARFMTPPRRAQVILRLAIAFPLTWAASAAAQELRVDGYVDLRLIAPPGDPSWRAGGLGPTRYDGSSPQAVIGAAVLEPSLQILPDLRAVIDVRYDPTETGGKLGLTEAYLRYRPVSTTQVYWWVKAGMFFAPISLENDSIGWSNAWTITSSAIDSWVGEELRTIGVEPTIEWRDTPVGTVRLFGAVFGDNETAGTLLGSSGWNLSDTITPLGGRVAQPTVGGVPASSTVFQQIDRNPGWYAGATVDSPDIGQVTVMRYDNDANIDANFIDSAWHTRFWSLAAKTDLAGITFLAQGMLGDTTVADSPAYAPDTHFDGAYLLAGYRIGEWRIAARIERFGTQGFDTSLDQDLSEHGTAETVALSWRPYRHLRLTAEWLHIDTTRQMRIEQGLAPRQVDNQEQLMARLSF